MSKVFIIAEAACTWLHGGLEAAYRSIREAKACGADAWKTQFTSDPEAMAMRRGVGRDKYTRLGWGMDALPLLKAECDRVGIEFMCTVFIPKDIPLIAPYVKRFKVSAFESGDREFVDAHPNGSRLVISRNAGRPYFSNSHDFSVLYCVSQYPTPLEALNLPAFSENIDYDGLSDHTTSTLTGAVAVGAGARIIEKHVRLSDTPTDDPDYGHSLVLDDPLGPWFGDYVRNVRLAERML